MSFGRAARDRAVRLLWRRVRTFDDERTPSEWPSSPSRAYELAPHSLARVCCAPEGSGEHLDEGMAHRLARAKETHILRLDNIGRACSAEPWTAVSWTGARARAWRGRRRKRRNRPPIPVDCGGRGEQRSRARRRWDNSAFTRTARYDCRLQN